MTSASPAKTTPPTLTAPIILLMSVATGVAVASNYYAQPLLHTIADAFGMPFGQVGMVVTAAQLSYAAGLILLVPLGDLFERRRLIVVMSLLSAGGLVISACAPSLTWLLVGTAITGLFSVVAQVLVPFAATLAAPEHRGRVVGTLMSGLLLGILLARTVAGLLSSLGDWRLVYAIAAGTLVLTANNTYTGGTDVRQGGLSVSKDASLGAASGGLTLSGGVLAMTASFDTNRAVEITRTSGIYVASGTTFGLAGAIAGSGDLTKTGTGMLTVSGDGSAYTGNALVQAGALNIASTGKLGGTLTLASGTLLQGAGQVGATTLQSGAILAPGNLNGTLNVAGDLTFMPGSVYQVAADPASSTSARVAVGGVANLAGSVVHVGPEGGFESTRQYTILTAGAINGQFNTVSSNYAFLDPALRYGTPAV
ncbi:hypothetical protein G6F32_012880 [Rhizopus arrhizus]|nr:hypothetical protein G6F32_012880 [Rhizopus arrhizus]